MNNNFIFAFKYLLLAFAAFIVPKMIVDSGRLVAPLEPNETEKSELAEGQRTRGFWPFVFSSQGSTGAQTSASGRRAAPERSSNDAKTPNGTFNSAFGGEKYGAVATDGNIFRRNDAFSDVETAGELERFDDFAHSARAENAFFSPNETLFPTPRKTLDELFRFQHSPDWFVENWARVDATPSEDGLLGYRVAVSTGADVDDLTGVLTCFFDATSERRVVFSGQTGDYRKTLKFLEREYGVALSPRSTAGRLLYESTLTTKSAGLRPSRLVVCPSRVFLRGSEKSFFNVDVVLERPYN